jgi:hypothetical protein
VPPAGRVTEASDGAHCLLDAYAAAKRKLDELERLYQARQALVYDTREQVNRQELEVSALWRRLQDEATG